MSKQTDAIKLALEALEQIKQETFHPAKVFAHNHAITAIREALAQPEQEPVAYLDEGLGAFYWAKDYKKHVGFKPLYTAPPQRKPLTDEEIADLWSAQIFHITDLKLAKDFVRDIEAAHNIKGEA